MNCFKIPFDHPKDAIPQMRNLEKKTGQKIHVYQCTECEKYHMTSHARSKYKERQKLKIKGKKDKRATW